MREPPRTLRQDDTLYRALMPEEYDESGPLPEGFESPGGHALAPSATLSFFVSRAASPTAALRAISRRARVRQRCATGRNAPSPWAMYARGYRVAALRAEHIRAACEAEGSPLRIQTDEGGNEYRPDGHLEVCDGHQFANTWAALSVILSQAETLGR